MPRCGGDPPHVGQIRNRENQAIVEDLEQWRVEGNLGDRFNFVLGRAIASIRRHETPITSGAQAKKDVQFVGEVIGNRITVFLENSRELQTANADDEFRPATVKDASDAALDSAPSESHGLHTRRGRGRNSMLAATTLTQPPNSRAAVQDSDEDCSEDPNRAMMETMLRSSMGRRFRAPGQTELGGTDVQAEGGVDSGRSRSYGRGRGRGRGRGNGRGCARNASCCSPGRDNGDDIGGSSCQYADRNLAGREIGVAVVSVTESEVISRPRTRCRAGPRGGAKEDVPGGADACPRKNDYEPRYRTGPYAILIALFKAAEEGTLSLSKDELVSLAQPYADEPMLALSGAGPSSAAQVRYCGWSSMNPTLIKKGLVSKFSNPAKYSLTLLGRALAHRLIDKHAIAEARTVHIYMPSAEAKNSCNVHSNSAQTSRGGQSAQIYTPSQTCSGNTKASRKSKDSIGYDEACASFVEWGKVTPMRETRMAMKKVDERLGRKRTDLETEVAASATGVLVAEGYGLEAVRSAVTNILESDADIPVSTEAFCTILRRRLPELRLPANTDPFAAALASATVRLDVRGRKRPRHSSMNLVPGDGAVDVRVENQNIASASSDVSADDVVYPVHTLSVSGCNTAQNCHKPEVDIVAQDIEQLIREKHNHEDCFRALEKLLDADGSLAVAKPVRLSLLCEMKIQGHCLSTGPVASAVVDTVTDGTMTEADVEIRPIRSGRLRDAAANANARDSASDCPICGMSVRHSAMGLHRVRCQLEAASQPSRSHRRQPKSSVSGRPISLGPAGISGEPGAGQRRQAKSLQHESRLRNNDVDDIILETSTDVEPVFSQDVAERSSGIAPAAEHIAVTKPVCDEWQVKEPTAEIILLIDNREFLGNGPSRGNYAYEMEDALLRCKVRPELRCLPAGDAMFILRLTDDGSELVLDHIIERKTLSDYVGSWKDGRVRRQTHALDECGIPRRMLILEGRLSELNSCAGLYKESGPMLQRHLCDLSVGKGYFVHNTRSMRETVATFASMYRHLERRYSHMSREELVRRSCGTYSGWAAATAARSKRLTVEQLFSLQLCNVPGIGQATARALVASGYRTAAQLHAAFGAPGLEDSAREGLLARAACFQGRQAVGLARSRTLCKLFTADQYETEQHLE